MGRHFSGLLDNRLKAGISEKRTNTRLDFHCIENMWLSLSFHKHAMRIYICSKVVIDLD